MPDIALFNSYDKRGDPFSKYDYMGVLPVLSHLKGFLQLCDDFRKSRYKIPKMLLDAECRAYIAIKDNQYVTSHYPWQYRQTDSWYTVIT